jgi:predicted kinase
VAVAGWWAMNVASARWPWVRRATVVRQTTVFGPRTSLSLRRTVAVVTNLTEDVGRGRMALVNTPLLIQMAGHGGSGKSTLARQLAQRIGGVTVDLDVIKTALLDAGIDWSPASTGSYEVVHALVDDFLATKAVCVVVDLPSYWAEIHERLTTAAARHEAAYVFIECEAPETVRAERLASRSTRRSQIPRLGETPADAPTDTAPVHMRAIVRPPDKPCLLVDTRASVDVDDVLAQIRRVIEP